MKVKLNIPEIKDHYVENLLHIRGIQDVQSFLNPSSDLLQDWRDLDNIDKGIELIKELNDNSRVGFIVDCDVDGYTSSAIIIQYLFRIFPNLNCTYYIHDGKSHGLEEHWEEISEQGFDLLIIPDAGSNDAEYAKQIDCPILILDHHITETAPADNMIVINNQFSEKYHNKNL